MALRIIAAAFGLVVIASGTARAQITTTDCNLYFGTQLSCSSHARPEATSGWAAGLQAASKGLDQMIQQMQARDAARAQWQREQLSDAALRAREEARFSVFTYKAQALLRAVVDSLHLAGDVRATFQFEGSKLLSTLFVASPDASYAEMWDLISPLRDKYASEMDTFRSRFWGVLTELADSRSLSTAARDTLFDKAAEAVSPIMLLSLAAPTDSIRARIEPFVLKYPRTSRRKYDADNPFAPDSLKKPKSKH
jgi:hypothetical protein